MIFKIEIEFFSNIFYFCINTHIIYPLFMHNDEKLKLHLIFRKKNCIIIQNKSFAGVMELADVPDSKSGGSDTVPVRPRSPAPENPVLRKRGFLIHCESKGISSTIAYHCISSVRQDCISSCYIMYQKCFRNDNMQNFVLMIYNFCGFDYIHGSAVIIL